MEAVCNILAKFTTRASKNIQKGIRAHLEAGSDKRTYLALKHMIELVKCHQEVC